MKSFHSLQLRVVESEWLDTLEAQDARAMHARRDLQRIHYWMQTQRILDRLLGCALSDTIPTRIVELGAGDGTLMLALAKRRAPSWPNVTVELLDVNPTVSVETLAAFQALGWQVQVVRADVFDWLNATHDIAPGVEPLVIANLFMHHFNDVLLQELVEGIAKYASVFVCVEPRRSKLALLGSRLVGLIGANDVTRHDAVTSVRAGFRATELSALWPNPSAWRITESEAGLFSHCYHAIRRDGS